MKAENARANVIEKSSVSANDYDPSLTVTTASLMTSLGLSAMSGKMVPTKNITAGIVADKIIDFCNEHGDALTNLKLQKLLYYTQAWYLALYDTPLFLDRFEALVHGPVQPDVYAKFSAFGHRPIDQPESNWKVPKRIAKHIHDVLVAYGQFSSYDLERLACDEEPWREARRGLASDDLSIRTIDPTTMKRYYAAKANGEERQE